jgi:hypothetical protein
MTKRERYTIAVLVVAILALSNFCYGVVSELTNTKGELRKVSAELTLQRRILNDMAERCYGNARR